MGSNTPPNRSSDGTAPWNQSGPVVTWCDECETEVREGDPTDHADGCQVAEDLRGQYSEKVCSVCSPPDDDYEGSTPVFCDNHDYEDYRVKLEHQNEIRQDEIDEYRGEGR